MQVLFKYYGYLSWVLKYQSTQVLSLSLSIKLKNCYIYVEYGYCISKSTENLGVSLRVHVLYVHIGPCNMTTKAKRTGTVLKPIKWLCRHHISSSQLQERPRDVY